MRVETIIEQLFFTTLRVTYEQEGQGASATAFVYSVRAERVDNPADAGDVHLLVTNRHVAEEAGDKLTVWFMRAGADGQPALGETCAVEMTLPPGSWFLHTNPNVDVAVTPLHSMLETMKANGFDAFYRAAPAAMALSDTNVGDLDAGEIVTFVGYPSGLYDRANATPIMRRGFTATPVALDYNGLPLFLIDASVFPGSSGSPVFIVNQGSWSPRQGGMVVGTRLILLGVVAAMHSRYVEAEIVQTRVGILVQDPINLGLVFKAGAIDECVDAGLALNNLRRSAIQPTEPSTPQDEAAGPAPDQEAA
jgi:Trypsin-like peptidase domain